MFSILPVPLSHLRSYPVFEDYKNMLRIDSSGDESMMITGSLVDGKSLFELLRRITLHNLVTIAVELGVSEDMLETHCDGLLEHLTNVLQRFRHWNIGSTETRKGPQESHLS